MNWASFALLLWLLLGLQAGLAAPFAIGPVGPRPDLVIPLVVFIALHAPHSTARWAALLAGLLLDLVAPVALDAGQSGTVVGPHALGLLLATQFTLSARSVVIGKNPLTLVVLTLLASCVLQAFVLLVLLVRSLYEPVAIALGPELLTRLGSATYTAGVALPMALALFAAQPLLGFASPTPRR